MTAGVNLVRTPSNVRQLVERGAVSRHLLANKFGNAKLGEAG
jgi:hypothetical protein